MPGKRLPIGGKSRGIPAGTINYVLSELDRQRGRLGKPPGPADEPPEEDTSILTVLVKNTSGQDLVERAIVGCDQSAFDAPAITSGPDGDVADSAILSGVPIEVVKPNATQHGSKWLVTLGPIKQDGVGFAVHLGLMWARVDVSDVAHKSATIQTDDTVYLKSDASAGRPIWSKITQTGKQWCLILLGGTGGGGSADNEVVIALIDDDIEGATEDAGKEQPNTDPAGDPLPLFALGPRNVMLKYFRTAQADRAMQNGSGTCRGGGANTITLADEAIAVTDYYKDATIKLSSGNERTITAYVAATREATVDANWTAAPVANQTTYAITKDDPGYKKSDSGTAVAGTANTITLAASASTTASYYKGATIRLTAGPGKGDERVITAYGTDRKATVNKDWSATPTIETEYDIPMFNLILATKETETAPGPPPTYKTEHETKKFFLLDGQGVAPGDYTRAEYDEAYGALDATDPAFLDENETFPPANSPAGYWKRRYRIEAKPDSAGKLWLDFQTCAAVAPPKLPT